MGRTNTISVFEHQSLRIGDYGFTRIHLDALLKLNEYHRGIYFEAIAKGIKFNQYVGVIQVDGLTIEINPKADRDDNEDNWKGVLLKMLQACGKLKPSSTGPAHVRRQHLNLLEVYFELYLHEVDSIIRRGLVKKYRKETKNTKALKGKLEFAGNIRHNLVHKERFYTTHQIYDTNHLLHQILYKALDIVDQFSRGTRLNDFCKRVLLHFPIVENKNILTYHLENFKLDRKSNGYQDALELARLIILNYSPDISGGREKMLSLLFDMNQLWEEFVLKQVRNACRSTAIEVVGQESKDFWGNNSLRPDIVLRKGSKTYIIDTKWKRPASNSASINDLRQMYAYCRFWNAEKALLLYPGKKDTNNFREYNTDDYFKIESGIGRINHLCKMGFVSVIEEGTNQLDESIGEKIIALLEIE
ncbi:hypothetical protein LCGC14_1378770 [marine sediment metagenome]|uniref:Restriction endonuclease n=2 Tax=root TaxID=1 RepID=A0A831QUS0_9FLAO|nr:restriction endonuclease [Pricia antarctica]